MSTRNEIGSEFWNIPLCDKENNIFPRNTRWLLSGRTALELIVIDSDIKTVSMPRWCCDSMIVPFKKHGVEVFFYENEPESKYDAIFVMDYFGFTDQINVPDGYKGVVIRDLTHSVFSKEYNDADYYFGSLRKWAGYITGGFAWGNWKKNIQLLPCDEVYVNLRKKAMNLKASYIEGKTDSKDFLNIYMEANEYLNKCGLCEALEEDVYAAKYLDIDLIKMKRRRNAFVLNKRVECLFQIKENDCPLFVPTKVKQRDELRKFLISNNVYFPIHWHEYDLDGDELSLVCDQRYEEKDMEYICDLIDRFYQQGRE